MHQANAYLYGHYNTRVYPKVSGLSHNEIYYNNKTLVEKQRKGLWRQNSLDWLIKYLYHCT